jgi:transcription-repair coupling factor (superfamily II helicase)
LLLRRASDTILTSMATDPLSLRFEVALERAISLGRTEIEVVGTDSTLSLALLLTQSQGVELQRLPNLIIVPTAKEAAELEQHLCFFGKTEGIYILPGFDVSPYSGLYPNSRGISARVRWLNAVANATTTVGKAITVVKTGNIFIATPEALIQRTLPPKVLKAHTFVFRKNQDLPSDLARALGKLGYQSTPVVEDEGTFAMRGGIVDIWSPAHEKPVRVELFGDTIESIRFFDPETQRSEGQAESFTVIPPREILYDDENRMRAATRFSQNVSGRNVDAIDKDSIQQSLGQGQNFPGLDFLIGDFYEEFATPLDHFSSKVVAWLVNPLEISRTTDVLLESLKKEYSDSTEHAIRPAISDLFVSWDQLPKEKIARTIELSKIEVQDAPFAEVDTASHLSYPVLELKFAAPSSANPTEQLDSMLAKVKAWREAGMTVLISAGTQAQTQRLGALFERGDLHFKTLKEDDYDLASWVEEQLANPKLLHIIPRTVSESLRINEEGLIFLRDEDFFGKKQRRQAYKNKGTLAERTHTLSFGDLNPGDAVVHILHGIGRYEGLKVMPIGGVDAEFITVGYKDGDKLYLPIYRINQIQKYTGPAGESLIDKLGGTQWAKVKGRVRNHLREIAGDLLVLYAKRSQVKRDPFPHNDADFAQFEAAFPYDETDDQLKAVDDIVEDMTSEKPMDRLVCGDVGFGKTEVAMRAAFKAIEGRRQVAVLAPTTVLSFQHLETFQKRFKPWPVTIRALNRFVPTAEARKTIEELKEGKVDIVVGTHRLLSKDVGFKDLGLMIIDEEQRFGVTHKEKIKRFKTAVDTLTLSATPIPRTLNMSLVGMRDLSIINTPPVDRLPTRTFVTKFDKETIGKAISAEIQRGGQVFFLHNRVQSIYSVADEIRQIVPEARVRVGHGQMEEHELEQVMVAFYHHQIDVFVCTTIIEAGIDNPRANTMFIDNAHQFGLSQLYQLRGRVGRSKERAYCYLLIPPNKRIESDAQERLKIIQENTELGSGIRIAHHDLELRGAGNLLGADQSGNIDAVGYEMYLELLEDAIKELKGEPIDEKLEPDINVRIPALIPETYIPDIRIRLSYYKALARISSPDDIDRIEEELTDQFGKIPEQVLNLMGLMLIRHHCKMLGIRDLSSGPKTISLAFTEKTPLPPQRVVQLAQQDPKKYSLTPDMRLNVRLNAIAWPNIYEEMLNLEKLCDPSALTGVAKKPSAPMRPGRR